MATAPGASRLSAAPFGPVARWGAGLGEPVA